MARTKNVIAPNDERSVVAMDKMAAALEKADKKWGDGLPFDQFRIETAIKADGAAVSTLMVRSGKYFHWLKEYLSHGEFVEAVERLCGKSRAWAFYCMKAAEMFSDVPPGEQMELGYKQIQALSTLDRPAVEGFLKGGPLGDIPHDDVMKMPVRKLEDEVRGLRKKLAKQKEKHDHAVREMSREIEDLRLRDDYRPPPTREQKAAAALAEFTGPYTKAVNDITLAVREALSVLDRAMRTPDIDHAQLNGWINQFLPDMGGARHAWEAWLGASDEAWPMGEFRVSDLDGIDLDTVPQAEA